MFVFKKEILGSNPLRFDEYVFYMAYGGSGTRATKMTERNSTMESSKSYFGSGKEVRESVGGTPVVFNTLAGGGRVQYTTAKPEGSKEFYLTDHLGSTREVYDLSTGNITYTSQYYPYGKQFSEYKSQAENTTEKFSGKEFEEGIDFNYHGARYYDPELGIWTSVDAARQFHGQYSYGNNPVNSLDPDGRTTIWLAGAGDNAKNAAYSIPIINKLSDAGVANVSWLATPRNYGAWSQIMRDSATFSALNGGPISFDVSYSIFRQDAPSDAQTVTSRSMVSSSHNRVSSLSLIMHSFGELNP